MFCSFLSPSPRLAETSSTHLAARFEAPLGTVFVSAHHLNGLVLCVVKLRYYNTCTCSTTNSSDRIRKTGLDLLFLFLGFSLFQIFFCKSTPRRYGKWAPDFQHFYKKKELGLVESVRVLGSL